MTTLYTHGINRPEQVVVLGDGNAEVRFNIQQDTETNPVIDPETGQPTGETETLVIFKAEHALTHYPLAYDELVDAMVRARYSQSAAEAVLRHKINGDEGADDAFDEFNAFAESCKLQAREIMGIVDGEEEERPDNAEPGEQVEEE